METQQRRLRRLGRSGRSRSLGSLQVLSGRSDLSKCIPKCTGYLKIQCSFCTAFQKMRFKMAQQTRESGHEALAPVYLVYGTVKAGSHCDISISISISILICACVFALSSKMADHDEKEELLEIGILLLISQRRNRKARKVPTPRKKNVCVRKDHLVKELSWIYL